MEECDHRRIKKNYPFGKKSAPTMFCKDCGKVMKNKEIKSRKKRR